MSIVEQSLTVINNLMSSSNVYLFAETLVVPVVNKDTNVTSFKVLTKADLKNRIRHILPESQEINVGAIAEHILHEPDLPFQRTSGLVTIPTFRNDFSLTTKPGYDPISKLYYAPDPQLKAFTFRTDASHADAGKAFDLLKELLHDFPFISDEDRLTYLAFLLTLFLRSAIPDVVPALVLDGNDQSLGKSLLSSMFSLIAYGEDSPSMSVPTSKAEWTAMIDSLLKCSARFQTIDNINGKFENDDFASVLTARRRRVRIKGYTEVKSFPCEVVFVLNGCDFQTNADMAQRIISCRLQHPNAKARKQDDFLIQKKYGCQIPELLGKRRAEYMQACLTIISGWVNDGAARRKKNLVMAKYGTWEGILGGIFDWLGKGVLLANHAQQTSTLDAEREERITFLTHLKKAFPDDYAFTTSEVATKVYAKDGDGNYKYMLLDFLPTALRKNQEGKSFVTSCGRWLSIAATLEIGQFRVVKSTNKDNLSVYKILITKEVEKESKPAASFGGLFEVEAGHKKAS